MLLLYKLQKQIEEAETRLEKLQDEKTTAKAAAGGTLSEEGELDFSRRIGKLERQIDDLRDKKYQQDYNAT